MYEMTVTEITFWVLVFLSIYTLKGYPLALRLLLLLKGKRPDEAYDTTECREPRPMVSFIVAAYNEEENIYAKIANLREVDYPAELMEFIIGSDCSTDGTDEIVKQSAEQDDRIRFFRMENRAGKIGVLHQAVQKSHGSILVFTDCSVKTNSDFMPMIISRFANPAIGLISSHDVWVDPKSGSPIGQNQYIEYEMKIRQAESDLSSLVSASGSFFAVRKELFHGYKDGLADDFALPLQVFRQGFRVVHCSKMIGYIPMVKSSRAEIGRRSRIIMAGIKTVGANLSLLFSVKHPIFAWQLWSHKVLKWLFPFLLIASAILSVVLWNEGIIYNIFSSGLALAILMGLLGFFIKGNSPLCKPFQTCNFILLSITAAIYAWARLLIGDGAKTWEPTHR